MGSKAGWMGLSQGLRPWGFLSLAVCVGAGQARVWAKLAIVQLRRQNLMLPPKRQGTGACGEGNGGAMSLLLLLEEERWGAVGLISGETGSQAPTQVTELQLPCFIFHKTS